VVYLFLAVAIALFALGLKVLGGVSELGLVVAATREATAVMTSRTLDEAAKEVAIRSAALGMFVRALAIAAKFALALAAPLVVVLLGVALDLYGIDDVLRAASDWYFILGSTLVLVGALIVVR
jgi:hypothetical protein